MNEGRMILAKGVRYIPVAPRIIATITTTVATIIKPIKCFKGATSTRITDTMVMRRVGHAIQGAGWCRGLLGYWCTCRLISFFANQRRYLTRCDAKDQRRRKKGQPASSFFSSCCVVVLRNKRSFPFFSYYVFLKKEMCFSDYRPFPFK